MKRSSSRASSRSTSSRHSELSTGYDKGNRGKARKYQSNRPPAKKSGLESSSSGNSSLFLTAAEQRAQQQKTEKKAADSPFGFLQDPRDVSTLCLNPSFSEICSCPHRKMVFDLVNRVMTQELCTFQKRLGQNSRHSRSSFGRCVQTFSNCHLANLLQCRSNKIILIQLSVLLGSTF